MKNNWLMMLVIAIIISSHSTITDSSPSGFPDFIINHATIQLKNISPNNYNFTIEREYCLIINSNNDFVNNITLSYFHLTLRLILYYEHEGTFNVTVNPLNQSFLLNFSHYQIDTEPFTEYPIMDVPYTEIGIILGSCILLAIILIFHRKGVL